MEAIETRLREVGVLDHDIRTRLNGPDKALVVTQRELVYADESGVQRTDLRDITKVATTSSGALSVRSAHGSSIEGSIRGFDVTELKFFFESVKTSVAQAKATLTSPPKVDGAAVDPWDELPTSKFSAGSPPSVPPATRLNGAGFNAANLNGANLNGANLNGANLNGASLNGTSLNGASKHNTPSGEAHLERQTLELPPLDPAALSRMSDPGLNARPELNASKITDSGVFSPRATSEIPPSVPNMGIPNSGVPNLNPRVTQETPSTRRMDVRYGEQNGKADALGYALPDNQFETGSLGALKAPSVVPSSNDWSGEAFDPKVSLETRHPSSVNVAPTLIESAASLKPLARWLRLLAGIFILAGIGMAAATVPGEKDSVMTWAYPAFYLLGSFLLSILSFGVAELLSVVSDMANDVRTTLRVTLKN
jgi:Pentapeptide repeats (8 copies)